MANFNDTHRNYESISPSARALLLMKGYTMLPYARTAAEIASLPDKFEPDFNRKDFGFWARVAHFESRYLHIDSLIRELDCTNFLELSSGFSFRGLQMTTEKDVYYIDTDLPAVIQTKKELMASMSSSILPQKGKLELLPLNALDETVFRDIIDRFPPGPITVVNEGLLMYLNTEEKKRLCRIIRDVLQERGGYWVTADIYLKIRERHRAITPDDELQHFLDSHHIEENKFENLQAAELFFRENGFQIDQQAAADFSGVGSLKYLLASIPADKLQKLKEAEKIQVSWRFRVA